MILRLSLFALVLCLAAAGPAHAQWWPWAKKKEQASEAVPKVFNAPNEQEGMPDKKWALDGIFDPKAAPAGDMVVNGIRFKGLKPEMMTSHYIPKSAEEIAMITYANKSWEHEAMKRMEEAAQARIAAAEKKAAIALAKMQQQGEAQLIKAQDAEQQAMPEVIQKTPEPPKVQIFNRPEGETPTKVFKNYR